MSLAIAPIQAVIVGKAEALMLDAIAAHKSMRRTLRTIKERALNCGLFLLSAHEACEAERPGSWTDFLNSYDRELPRRTAYRYLQFAQACLAKADELNPGGTDPKALREGARKMVAESDLSFIQLLRELAPVKVAPVDRQAKIGQTCEIEFPFNWSVFDSSLWALEKVGATVLREVPTDALQETRNRLKTALQLTETELGGREAL